MTTRILLVEDDELIGTMVSVNLESAGHAVRWERSAAGARRLACEERFDLLVLDLMLPDGTGLDVLGAARRAGVTTPAIMLTVRSEVPAKVAALDGGVDDYLTKPFDMAELLARVRALLRRGQAAAELPSAGRLGIAGGTLDLDARRFTDRDGTAHALSEKEAELLALFARNPRRTLSRADVLEEVWGMGELPPERTVDNFVLRLRRVLGDDPEQPRHVTTVRGRGYRFEP